MTTATGDADPGTGGEPEPCVRASRLLHDTGADAPGQAARALADAEQEAAERGFDGALTRTLGLQLSFLAVTFATAFALPRRAREETTP